MIVNKNLVALLGLVFCFVPYFSLYPILNYLQPLYLLPILFLTFFDIKLKNFTKFEIIFLMLALYSLVFINISIPAFNIAKFFTLFFGFLTFHFSRVYFKIFKQKHLFFIVLFNFLMILFHFVNPSIFIKILGSFFSIIKLPDVTRGFSGASPEPGLMGGLSVFYIAISLFLKKYKNQTNFFYINIFLSFLIILMTKSGTGFLFLFIFIFFFFFKFNLKKLLKLLIIISALAMLMLNIDFGRGSFILKFFINSPLDLLFIDESVSMRTTNILIGIFSVKESIIGHGYGSWEKIASVINLKYDIFQNLSSIGLGQLSGFAEYSVRIGLIYWIFLSYFIFYSIKNKKTSFMILAMLFITSSYSMAFPPIWILLSIVIYGDQIIGYNNKSSLKLKNNFYRRKINETKNI